MMGKKNIRSPGDATLYQAKRKTIRINGFGMHYVEIGPKNAESIIFLHGYTDSICSWATTAPLLSDTYRVFVLDQRGHGDSEKPSGGYHIAQFSEDVIAFMDAVGVKKAIVVGHSMGSFIAHYLAAIHPERISAIVLIGSAPSSAGNPAATELYEMISAPDFSDPVDPAFIREWQTCQHPLDPTFAARQAEQCAKVPVRVWRAALVGLMTDDHAAFLSHINVPTLVIWGEKDDFFSKSDQEALLAAIPDANLKIYADTGHNVQWEPERSQEVADDIRSFLENR